MSILNPITPPTDNLYKFTALSGIALIIFSGWLFQETLQDAVHEGGEARLAKSEANGYLKEADFRATELEGWMRAQTAKEQGGKLARGSDAWQEPKQILDQYDQAVKQLSQAQGQLDSYEFSGAQSEMLGPQIRLPVAYLALGLTVSAIGFALWYFKVQKAQDDLLALELSSMRTLANIESES
ncbi:MAG TPA: hypothetical protein VG944_22140 [Fimbriimonas sp.]|nr:hypothetical protein [Fimbriimonas sp.]